MRGGGLSVKPSNNFSGMFGKNGVVCIKYPKMNGICKDKDYLMTLRTEVFLIFAFAEPRIKSMLFFLLLRPCHVCNIGIIIIAPTSK